MNFEDEALPAARSNPFDGKLSRAVYSDRGKLRERNEDACTLPYAGADEAAFGTLLALADGAGGLPGWAEASREAVHYLQALYYARAGPTNPSERLRNSFEAVNALSRIAQRQLGLERGRITTLVAAVVYADQVWVANIGDSRAYLIQARQRQIQQLTEDHSQYVRDVKAGQVSDSDLASHQSGRITRAIGLHELCQVDTYHYTWIPGDRLLLCSDGLVGLSEEEILSTVLDNLPEVAARELVLRSVQVDGQDNCTAVVAAWLPSVPTDTPSETSLQDTIPSKPQVARLLTPESSPTISIPAKRSPKRTVPAHRKRLSARRNWLSLAKTFWLKDYLWYLLLGLLLGWLSAILIFILLVGPDEIMKLF